MGSTLLDVAVKQARERAPLTFEELVRGCSADEREQLAWHLAMIRARRTFERLRRPPEARDE